MFNKKSQNISELFAKWGKEQCILPARAEEIKAQVSEVQERNRNAAIIKRPFGWFRLSFALAGLLLIVVCAPRFFRNYQIDSFPIRTEFSASHSQNISLLEDNIIGESDGEAVESYNKNGGLVEDYLGNDLGIAYDASTGLGENNSVLDKISQMFDKRSTEDNREFMQTDYYARLRVREVEDLAHDAELLVRGLGGRVDNSNIGKKYANISFVLPKTAYALFKDEVGQMAGARFIEENESNRNLLPEKQTTEKNLVSNEEKLTELEKNKQDLTNKHNQIIAKYTNQKKAVANKIYELSHIAATSTEHEALIKKQIADYSDNQRYLKKKIAEENTLYENKLKKFEAKIAGVKGTIQNWTEADQNILETVETVSGTISFEWISVWGIVDEYVQFVVSVPIICVLLIITGLTLRRERGFDLP